MQMDPLLPRVINQKIGCNRTDQRSIFARGFSSTTDSIACSV